MHAVIRTGGKQYVVEPGKELSVEKLPGQVGDAVTIRDVLLTATDEHVTVGKPTVTGATVVGTIVRQGRTRKITAVKYKPKVRYKKTYGHRQDYTRIKITDITTP